MTATLRAVIVPFAGTLVDFGAIAPVDALVRLFARHGVELTRAEARQGSQLGPRDRLETLAAGGERWADAHGGREPTTSDVARLHAELGALQLEAIVGHAGAIPGAATALAALRSRGLRVLGTSGYGRDHAAPLEARARAQGILVDDVIDVPSTPAGWPEAARRLGIEELHEIASFSGDAAGVAAARAAGMWSIGVAATGGEVGLDEESFRALPEDERDRLVGSARDRLLAAGAHAVIDSIAEAPALVGALDARLTAGERP